MIVCGIKLNLFKLLTYVSDNNSLTLLVTNNKNQEFIIYPYTENSIMLAEVSGKEDLSYPIVKDSEIHWVNDTEFELLGDRYQVSTMTLDMITNLGIDTLQKLI